MSVLDVESLLAAVSPAAPCGENLEYDPDYAAMEQAAAGTPEQQFGKTVIPAEDPDWKEVRSKALDLLPRSKDLRIALYLVRSATYMDGMPGLADGLAIMSGLVDQHWPTVHPQLDPDDDNDPTLRINTIAGLTDPPTTLRGVREAMLVRSRAFGRFSYYDVLAAAGEVPPLAGEGKPEQSSLDGAFADCDAAELKATAADVSRALELTRTLEQTVSLQVGVGQAPPLDPLVDMLAAISKLLTQKLAARGLLDDEPEPVTPSASGSDGAASGDGHAAASGANGHKASAPMSLTGDISSREDVIRALDKICDYYKRYEPSSPVPLFLNRAKRLASKSFLEILRDLTPDAVNQALAIGGIGDGVAPSGVDTNDV